MNILGTQKDSEKFQRQDFKHFVKAHMDTTKIVFSCVWKFTDGRSGAIG